MLGRVFHNENAGLFTIVAIISAVEEERDDLVHEISEERMCPRLRIRETTEEPTPMQVQEGLLTSSSLRPSRPDTVEQGLGPHGGFQLNFMGWFRGPPEGVEKFLKFCLHSDMEAFKGIKLCSHSNMGLSRALSCFFSL